MKKFRSIISVILAAVMIMSTWTLCFIASAESAAESLTPIAEMWEFDISVGDSGSAATLADGPFSLASKAGALSGTVTEVNGVASIVTTEETPRRAFSKSPSGIIDITPAMTTVSQIIFTAPVAGEYYYDVSVVITSTTVRADLWTEIGKYKDGWFNSTDPAWGYSCAAITNGTFDGRLYNTDRLNAAKTVTLAAGETLILSVQADTGNGNTNTDETQLTVNKFNVIKTNGEITTDNFACSTTVKDDGNFRLMGTAYGTGDVDLLEGTARNTYWDTSGKCFTWYGAADDYWDYNGTNTKYPYFTTSQCGGVLDAAPLLGTKSIVQYTADKAGLYSFSGTFTKITWGEGVTSQISVFKNTSESLITPQSSADGGHVFNVSGEVQLNKGDTVWFVVETTEGGGSTEVGINSLSMTCLRYATNVSATPYLTLEDGSTMWLMLNEVGKLPDGEVYTIDGTPMFWSDKYNAYCYLKIANNEAAELSSEFAVVNDTAQSVDYGMDVNMSGTVEINDAQLAYNMYNVGDGVDYTNFDVVSMEKFLRADVNGDRKIDTSDVSLILSVYAYDYEPDSDEPLPQQVPMWIAHGYDRVDPSTTKPSNASTNYTVYMAKNEDEGVNIALRSDTARSSLSIKPLSGENADIVWKAYYARPVTIDSTEYTDALIPLEAYGDISLTANVTTGIYLDFKSSSDTPAGDYPYEFALVDVNGNVLSTVKVTVHVWNFELYSDGVKFATAVRKDQKGLMASPVDHYEFLLDYGLCAYDLPYDILDERANAYMSDPRVTSFKVPHDVDDATLQAYYAKLQTKEEWLEKAYFYPADEPVTSEQLENLKTICTKLKELCPQIRITCPYYTDVWYDKANKIDQIEFMDEYIDLHCPKLANWDDEYIYFGGNYIGWESVNPTNSDAFYQYGPFANRITEIQKGGETVWSYVCNEPDANGYLNLTVNNNEGLGHRVFLWQFYQRNIEGFLYWHVNAWDPLDPWNNLDVSNETYHGDGILTYPGDNYGLYGQLLPSVRLVGVRDGLEDIELMYMAEELLASDWQNIASKVANVSTSLTTICDSEYFNSLRIEIGNAIEQALNNQ